MSLVVDASVAVKWVMEESGSDRAAALRSESLVAPSLWLAEAGSALWKKVRRHEISSAEAVARFERLRRAPVQISGIEADHDAALELAFELAHPIYDCLYLALALRLRTCVITADRRFHDVARKSKRSEDVVVMLDEFDRATRP